jgi:alanine-glyoxylate transaminase / serine-glyoxylate transaminase / serine-pyruvate transaminase
MLQPMDLADGRVDDNIAACEDGLKRLLNAGHAQPFLYAGNGHGAWEAVIANLLGPGKTVLVPGTGHFSDGWAEQCEALGAKVIRTPWMPGLPIDNQAVGEALLMDRNREITAVFAVHTDTASGITSDMAALRQVIDHTGHPALFVVDGVASVGATPIDMQALRANVVLGASQKALMVPPGLAFVLADEEALEVAKANPNPRYYWDWARRHSPLSYRKFCGTPPHPLLAGLRAAFGLIFEEGLEPMYSRHRLLAGAVQAAVEGWAQAGAVAFFGQVQATRSVSVTTIAMPAPHDPEALRTFVRERLQVSISGGLGPLAGKVFRIGHMGDLNPAMMLGCLAAVEAGFHALNVPHGPGVVRAQALLAQALRTN